MPIVAESGPLTFGGPGDGTPSPTRVPTGVPSSPTPSGPNIEPSSNFVAAHQAFIQQVDTLNSCFKKEEIKNLTNTEIDEHLQIAMIDKYIVQHNDMFCSKQGVKNLSDKLQRFID